MCDFSVFVIKSSFSLSIFINSISMYHRISEPMLTIHLMPNIFSKDVHEIGCNNADDPSVCDCYKSRKLFHVKSL